jgi:hypothetical protein
MIERAWPNAEGLLGNNTLASNKTKGFSGGKRILYEPFLFRKTEK